MMARAELGARLRSFVVGLLLLAHSARAVRTGHRVEEAAPLQPAAQVMASAEAAKADFLRRHGHRYGYAGRIDDIYAKEIAPRLGPDEHYMDWTAAALYLNSQVAAATEELQRHVFGNPHSASPSSLRTDKIVESTRAALLEFFGASPDEYTLIFARSGTGALHMVGEAFPWTPESRFTFLTSNHNSLLGIREYARQHNASFGSIEESQVEEWLESTAPAASSGRPRSLASAAVAEAAEGGDEKPPTYSLFGYPAYDNFAGVMYPLSWVKQIQARSNDTHIWKVLLDAAAFVPTHKLNLTETPADFVDLSFYKLFGFPTGIGALIVRNENVPLLRKLYWGGGSVFLATSALDWHYWRQAPHSWEHGTLAFLDIIAIRHGLRVYEQLGGIEAVQKHVAAVGEYFFDELSKLQHSNGNPVVRVFGKHALPNRREVQGSTINFEVLGVQGEVIGYKEVAQQLGNAGFHVRTGCTCNPGACYQSTGVRDEEVRQLAEQKQGHFEVWEWIWVNRNQLTKLPLGSIRVSLGMMSRWEDAHALLRFIKENYTDVKAEDLPAADKQPAYLFPGWC